MRKQILKRFFTPMGFFVILLLVTLLFGAATVFMQLFLNELQPLVRKVSQKATDQLVFVVDHSQYQRENLLDYDYEKCKQLTQANDEIGDLRRMKASYLNELKNIESKRNRLRNYLEQLQHKVDSYTSELTELRNKNVILKQEIASNLLKSSELNIELKKSVDLIETLKTSRNYTLMPDSASLLSNGVCTVEKCFDFSKCELNTKLNVFVYNSQSTFDVNAILSSLNQEQISRYMHLSTKKVDKACLIIAFLIDKANIHYYVNLVEFLHKHAREHNVLLVNLDTSTFVTVDDFKNYLEASESVKNVGFDLRLLSRFMFAGFDYLEARFYSDLFVHFSLNANLEYMRQQTHESFSEFNQRTYLFSYHYNAKATDRFVANENIEFLNTLFGSMNYSELRVLVDLKCSTWLTSGISDESSVNKLCFDVKERDRILLNSTFTLLVSDRKGLNWDYKMVKYFLLSKLTFTNLKRH